VPQPARLERRFDAAPNGLAAADGSALSALPSTDGGISLDSSDAGADGSIGQTYPFQEPVTGACARAPGRVNLSPAACLRELQRRHVPASIARLAAPGVGLPVRISGTLHGVSFIAPGPRSKFGILDCRLLLTLDRFAELLEQHGVTEVRIDNFYRPRAHLPGRKAPSQHAFGLAADILGFQMESGRELVVERDFNGRIGDPPCGPDARANGSSEATIELRNLVCDIARAALFNDLLTPNFNEAHRNHLHADIKGRGKFCFLE
jgi:hypothetical protein